MAVSTTPDPSMRLTVKPSFPMSSAIAFESPTTTTSVGSSFFSSSLVCDESELVAVASTGAPTLPATDAASAAVIASSSGTTNAVPRVAASAGVIPRLLAAARAAPLRTAPPPPKRTARRPSWRRSGTVDSSPLVPACSTPLMDTSTAVPPGGQSIRPASRCKSRGRHRQPRACGACRPRPARPPSLARRPSLPAGGERLHQLHDLLQGNHGQAARPVVDAVTEDDVLARSRVQPGDAGAELDPLLLEDERAGDAGRPQRGVDAHEAVHVTAPAAVPQDLVGDEEEAVVDREPLGASAEAGETVVGRDDGADLGVAGRRVEAQHGERAADVDEVQPVVDHEWHPVLLVPAGVRSPEDRLHPHAVSFDREQRLDSARRGLGVARGGECPPRPLPLEQTQVLEPDDRAREPRPLGGVGELDGFSERERLVQPREEVPGTDDGVLHDLVVALREAVVHCAHDDAEATVAVVSDRGVHGLPPFTGVAPSTRLELEGYPGGRSAELGERRHPAGSRHLRPLGGSLRVEPGPVRTGGVSDGLGNGCVPQQQVRECSRLVEPPAASAGDRAFEADAPVVDPAMHEEDVVGKGRTEAELRRPVGDGELAPRPSSHGDLVQRLDPPGAKAPGVRQHLPPEVPVAVGDERGVLQSGVEDLLVPPTEALAPEIELLGATEVAEIADRLCKVEDRPRVVGRLLQLALEEPEVSRQLV